MRLLLITLFFFTFSCEDAQNGTPTNRSPQASTSKKDGNSTTKGRAKKPIFTDEELDEDEESESEEDSSEDGKSKSMNLSFNWSPKDVGAPKSYRIYLAAGGKSTAAGKLMEVLVNDSKFSSAAPQAELPEGEMANLLASYKENEVCFYITAVNDNGESTGSNQDCVMLK